MKPENLDELLKRFQNRNYSKAQNDITLELKVLCLNSIEFDAFIALSTLYSANLDLEEALSRQFLAGLIIGVLLEREFKL